MRISARTTTGPGPAGASSTASQTAWALLALLAAGSDRCDQVRAAGGVGATSAVERGVGFLVDTQRADGNWDEDRFTGTGFPGDFYINYHLYRLVFPDLRARPLPEGRLATDQ